MSPHNSTARERREAYGLEGAVDTMGEAYGLEGAVRISLEILRNMKFNSLAERLQIER